MSAEQEIKLPSEEGNKALLHQDPSTMWIGCSDSRVPEFVTFGTERGTVFVHRNIGNQIDPRDGTNSVLASVEYAVRKFKSLKRIYVVGHTKCGAVEQSITIAQFNNGQSNLEPKEFHFVNPYLQTLVSLVCDVACRSPDLTGDELHLEVVVENVRRQVDRIAENKNLKLGEVHVEGVVYHLGEEKPWQKVARLERRGEECLCHKIEELHTTLEL